MSLRTVLITGANSGVGFAASRIIANASENFHVIMSGRSLAKVEQAKAELEADNVKGSLSAIQLDVTDPKSIKQAVDIVQEKYGQLEVIVNNAAIGSRCSGVEARMRSCLETNVLGPAMVAEAFRPLLLKAQNPYSIYITSGLGSLTQTADPLNVNAVPIPFGDAYMVSKAALNMIAILESRLYGEQGLKVFAFCPGFVVSNLRGTSEEERTGWGEAGDPLNSGKSILSLILGERDADVGKFVHKDGVYPW